MLVPLEILAALLPKSLESFACCFFRYHLGTLNRYVGGIQCMMESIILEKCVFQTIIKISSAALIYCCTLGCLFA